MRWSMLAVENLDDTRDRSGDASAAEPPELPDAHEARPTSKQFDLRKFARRVFDATWPKVGAILIFLLGWQCVVWYGYRPRIIKPPGDVASAFVDIWRDGVILDSVGYTMRRALIGFALALVIGIALGSIVSGSKIVRSAIGSMISGVQTMPSIAWFPLAIALFTRGEGSIRLVIVLGAAPAIANGLISGIDQIPPLLLRAGRMVGARGVHAYRHVILPAALPSFVGGLKQGWAFAWRSLLAGELLVNIAGKPSLGHMLSQYRDLAKYEEMFAIMFTIFAIGLIFDAVVFGTLDRKIRRRWGLLTD
jgi:NitT/TauT family transport system permease protein